MTTKIKTTLLTVLFFFGLLTGLQAQDKYEFASVAQWGAVELKISIEGKPFEKQPLGKEVKDIADHLKLFDYVNKLQNEGWEVYNVMFGDVGTMTFVLRRKK